MDDRGRYCCFTCPGEDQSLKALTDACPECGRSFGFPLSVMPKDIAGYEVTQALGRGFYGATYVAVRKNAMRSRRVLKVIPKKLYDHFGKDFERECAQHAEVAEHAEYVVGIDDVFDADISFDGLVLPCHVAVLDFLDGKLLASYVHGSAPLNSNTAAQIAADLIRLKGELESRLANHNDLHAYNIVVEQLRPSQFRQGAMDPAVRAIAIDLGSVGPDRRSGGPYVGDLHWIARHIDAMVDRLLASGDESDLDARVALALRMIAQSMAPAVESQRTPSPDDWIKQIEAEYFRTSEPWRPWRVPFALRTFHASYNAQTLDAWHVPQLLVDPYGTWRSQIGAQGPLVMTGMRGCGKTLLLRAVQFHARAAQHADEPDEKEAFKRIKTDGYVGLFVSAQRLLNVAPAVQTDTSRLFARLFVAYALEAARAIAHLSDMAADQVGPNSHLAIAAAVAGALHPQPEIPDFATVEQLERYLVRLLVGFSRMDSPYTLASHPSNAFPNLAEAIRSASPVWQNAQVLFLLDDVSTRYITVERIEELLSALIFQNPSCAFKLTSETQTIFLSLKTPGQVHPAAHWRDFTTFDLGSEVNQRLKTKGAKKFVEQILRLRAKFYATHPKAAPSQVLGDVNLEQIAIAIAASNPDSRDRKKVYHGISALAGVCVGDIGSVITLYENILGRSAGAVPASAQVQNEAYQDYCSRQLYLLDRRGSDLKDVAKSFAEASHELLVQSAPKQAKRGLRQYASIYIRVTTGDFEEQRKRLRELVDAGIFVFAGGAPRTKTRDSNPTLQFKLTYRKIYGLANYIGLAERDRFELSGAVLEEWLDKPASGKDILMRNLVSEGDLESEADDDRTIGPEQARLDLVYSDDAPTEMPVPLSAAPSLFDGVRLPMPRIVPIPLSALSQPVTNLVLGLGFEERTAKSAKRMLEIVKPGRVIAVRYDEPGRGGEITDAIRQAGLQPDELPYDTLAVGGLPDLRGRTIIDVTGLAKPAIFHLIRRALRDASEVDVVYTAAEQYAPREEALAPVLAADSESDHHKLLVALKDVLTGEDGPYQLSPLLVSQADGTRMRSLYAFASSKHERLIQIIEERDYDLVRVMVGNAENARSIVARIAAEVAVRGSERGAIERRDPGDPAEVLDALGTSYEAWYVHGGANFEIGLTGNKLQAVAAAALSAAVHVNQVWYVRPARFDRLQFTQGTGSTRCYRITL